MNLPSRQKIPHLRIIYPSDVSGDEAAAALRGSRIAEKYGVLCDSMPATAKAIEGMKNGKAMLRLAKSPVLAEIVHGVPSIEFMNPFRKRKRDALLGKNIMGIALTNRELFELSPVRIGTECFGLSTFGAGGALSIKKSRKVGGELYLRAIELVARHETGHILINSAAFYGSAEHCTQEKCIMRSGQGRDIVETIKNSFLEFCQRCDEHLKRTLCK